jgi:serine/threonine protein kinase
MFRVQDTFIKKALLGQGSYGTVYRVLKKLNQTEYALKYIDGNFLRRYGTQTYITINISFLYTFTPDSCVI